MGRQSDVVKEESSARTMPITIRVTKVMSDQIDELLETEGFSSRADVVYSCTRFFMEDIRRNICENNKVYYPDKRKYEIYLSGLSKDYEKFREKNPDKSDSANITLRISKTFYYSVQTFNFDTVRYSNAQTFMRVAIAWYYNIIHHFIMSYDMRNMWEHKFEWMSFDEIMNNRKNEENDG